MTGSQRPTLDAVAADYLAFLAVERGASQNTIDAYRGDLTRYLQACREWGKPGIADVQQKDVEQFLKRLRSVPADVKPQPLSDASVARAMAAVRGLHQFALREGLVSADVAVTVRPPVPGLRLPEAITVDEIDRLLAAPGEDPIGLRDRAVLEFMYGTGCRVSEATGCDVDDVHLTERAVRLFGKGRKERVVPIGSQAISALQAYLVRVRPSLAEKQGSPALFLNNRGGRLSRQSVWTLIKRAADKAGLPESIHPHTLRHSCATHLLEGGADIRVVQELLGHASVTTTQIYTKVTIEHLREVYATTHPRAR